MAITFPVNPAGQTPVNTFSPTSTPVANSANSLTYTWDGVSWTSSQAGNYVNATGDTMTGPLVVPTVTAQDITTGGNTVVGYQQGTGTPYFVNITNAYSDALSSYTSQTMSWARVGNLVSFNLYCEAGAAWSLTNGTQPDSFVGINGLPYHMVAGAASGYPSCVIGYWNKMGWDLLQANNFAGGNPTAYLGSDTLGPTVGLAYPTYASSGQDVSRITFDNSVWNANSAIQISGQYITDDTTWIPVDGATVS